LDYYNNKNDSKKYIVNNTKDNLYIKNENKNIKEEEIFKIYTYKNLLKLDLNEISNYFDDENKNLINN